LITNRKRLVKLFIFCSYFSANDFQHEVGLRIVNYSINKTQMVLHHDNSICTIMKTTSVGDGRLLTNL